MVGISNIVQWKKIAIWKVNRINGNNVEKKKNPDISLLQYKMAYRFFILAFYFEHSLRT